MKDRNGIRIRRNISAIGGGGVVTALRYSEKIRQVWQSEKTVEKQKIALEEILGGYVCLAEELAMTAANHNADISLYERSRLLGKAAYAMRQAARALDDYRTIRGKK